MISFTSTRITNSRSHHWTPSIHSWKTSPASATTLRLRLLHYFIISPPHNKIWAASRTETYTFRVAKEAHRSVVSLAGRRTSGMLCYCPLAQPEFTPLRMSLLPWPALGWHTMLRLYLHSRKSSHACIRTMMFPNCTTIS